MIYVPFKLRPQMVRSRWYCRKKRKFTFDEPMRPNRHICIEQAAIIARATQESNRQKIESQAQAN